VFFFLKTNERKEKRVEKTNHFEKKKNYGLSNTRPMENPPMNLYVFRSVGLGF
jgi:hypothetical protein